MKRLSPLLCLVYAMLVAAADSTAPMYHLTDLGTLDGDLCSTSWDINKSGQIVGCSAGTPP